MASRHSTRLQQALYEGDGSRIRGQTGGRQGGTMQGTAMNNYQAHQEPETAHLPQRGHGMVNGRAPAYAQGQGYQGEPVQPATNY